MRAGVAAATVLVAIVCAHARASRCCTCDAAFSLLDTTGTSEDVDSVMGYRNEGNEYVSGLFGGKSIRHHVCMHKKKLKDMMDVLCRDFDCITGTGSLIEHVPPSGVS